MSISIISESTAAPTTNVVTRNRIAAFVSDDISAAALRTGLDGTTQILDVRRGDIRHATRLLESDIEFHSVIADIANLSDSNAAIADLARVCPADVAVVLIGETADLAFYRQIIAKGILEYLAKPLTRDAVQGILRPKLVGSDPDQDRGGHVVAVCGAQGGAGTTSIAVNLAMQLAETTKARVALLDLHVQGGEAAVMLGVQPGPGLRIALEDPTRADTLFIERAAIEVNDKVRLIAADEPMDAELRITEAGMQHILSVLRQRFNFIVVDVPVPLTPAIKVVVEVARHVLVLLEAEMTGLRNSNELRRAVTAVAGRNRVFTVLNRANRPGGLDLAAVTHGLGSPPDIVIPDLGKKMTEAVNLCIPALQLVPALRRHLAPLVREIAGIKTDDRKSLFRRLLGR